MTGTKKCTKCGKEKALSEFYTYKYKGEIRYEGKCKECKKQYYEDNKEKIAEQKKQYYEDNKEKIAEQNKQYREDNKEKFKIYNHNREAMKKALPHDLTDTQWDNIMDSFNYECALSHKVEDLSLEHFMPLCIGHGGTTIANVYPMELSLNISKNGSNPFEWIKRQPEELQDNFYNVLVPYMAEVNEMTVKEFEDYVYWCFENPRTIEEAEADTAKGVTSKDLFIQAQLVTM